MANRSSIDQKEFQGGERLYLGRTVLGDAGINEHLDRYRLAAQFVTPDSVVLDAACGSGYGSEMLAEKAKKVIGIEINDHALSYARENSAHANAAFLKGDMNERLPVDDATCDVIASFETLEHIADQENMMKEFKRILKPGGVLVLSSPDREIITDKAHAENHFHIHELSKKEFVSLLRNYFSIKALYGQTKYIPPSKKKRIVKKLAKLDVFKLRRKIINAFGLKLVVHEMLSVEEHDALQPVALDTPNDYFVLVAVAKKAA